MAEDKWFLADEDSAYGEGILVDEYNGDWSLVQARQGQDGKTYMQWCYPQKHGDERGPMDRSVPWKIKLGNSKEEAVMKLRELAAKIEGEEAHF